MPRFKPPKLPKALEALGPAFAALYEDLAALEQAPGDVAIKGSTYRASAGETVRVSPPPEGMGLVLPPPSADNRSQTITVIIERPAGDLRVFVSQDGPAGPSGAPTIDGEEMKSYSTEQALRFVSNGSTRWSDARGATGATGAAGATGATGAAGATGATGAAGTTGAPFLASMVANVSATNTTANQTLVTYTVAANGWAAGEQYDFDALIYHSRGATALSSNIVVELLVAGAVVRTLTLVLSTTTSNSRAGHFTGHVRCITTGAGGTLQSGLFSMADYTGTANAPTRLLDPQPTTSAPASTALDTTASTALELRMRMSAAVTDLTLYCTRAIIKGGA